MLEPDKAVVQEANGKVTLNFEKPDGTIDSQVMDSPLIAAQNLYKRTVDNQKAFEEHKISAEKFKEDALLWEGMYKELSENFDEEGKYIGPGAGNAGAGDKGGAGKPGDDDSKPVTKGEMKTMISSAFKEEFKTIKSTTDKEARQREYSTLLSQAQVDETRLSDKATLAKAVEFIAANDVEGKMKRAPALARQFGNNVFRVALFLAEKEEEQVNQLQKNAFGTGGGSRGGGGSQGGELTAEQRRSLSPEQRDKYFDATVDKNLQKQTAE